MHSRFINFSNHPSCHWGRMQVKAAVQYGVIEDYPFPLVPPEMSAGDVYRLANEYVEQLLKAYGAEITVHVMGEMTFSFMVVTRLKELGIKCVASTTERKVTYDSDGVKQTVFSFVKFREY